jgi:hypothetical protein
MKDNTMSAGMSDTRESLLFTYVIASADMRYIERSEREIYLRTVEGKGPIVRGEIPDCGPACFANLGQILLEYAMSCEGCKDDVIEAEMAEHFGERLGHVLANKLGQPEPDAPAFDRLEGAFLCVLNSMGVPFNLEKAADRLRCQLAEDPIDVAAAESGIQRGAAMARCAFVSLCSSLVKMLAPEWALERPSEADVGEPLGEIIVVRAAG